jgi:hypothetical protein
LARFWHDATNIQPEVAAFARMRVCDRIARILANAATSLFLSADGWSHAGEPFQGKEQTII